MLRNRKDPILVVQQGKKRGRAHALITRAKNKPIIQTDLVPRVFAAGQFIMADKVVASCNCCEMSTILLFVPTSNHNPLRAQCDSWGAFNRGEFSALKVQSKFPQSKYGTGERVFLLRFPFLFFSRDCILIIQNNKYGCRIFDHYFIRSNSHLQLRAMKASTLID